MLFSFFFFSGVVPYMFSRDLSIQIKPELVISGFNNNNNNNNNNDDDDNNNNNNNNNKNTDIPVNQTKLDQNERFVHTFGGTG